jgi:hypothetical protein
MVLSSPSTLWWNTKAQVYQGVSVKAAYVLAQDPKCGRCVHRTDRAWRRQ